MKRSIEGFNQLNTADEVAKAKLKQKHLLNEFLELQKEFVSKKRKLQAAKQRRDIILGEILCWLLLLLCSMVAGSEDVPAFLLYLPLVQGSLRFIKALFMYYSNRLCIYFIFALYTLFLEAHDLYYQFFGEMYWF
ncbi:uncharacterized protein [Nicotiana tomentosiformis]|uniref:uncharacterized protein isoform X1 n=1 Tax=Nicotiana tomentosiformis TaxID=4098 RepID=UPI00388C4480